MRCSSLPGICRKSRANWNRPLFKMEGSWRRGLRVGPGVTARKNLIPAVAGAGVCDPAGRVKDLQSWTVLEKRHGIAPRERLIATMTRVSSGMPNEVVRNRTDEPALLNPEFLPASP